MHVVQCCAQTGGALNKLWYQLLAGEGHDILAVGGGVGLKAVDLPQAKVQDIIYVQCRREQFLLQECGGIAHGPMSI